MVVFTCNNCGESLQKPKVEKHYLYSCRCAKNLTCVDCFKDFRNEEYQAHTKCVTEEERYSAKGTYPNSIQKKGAVKQDSWIDLVTAAIDSAGIRRGPHAQIVETVLASSNVPRKKSKFFNFVKSACGSRTSMMHVETVWNCIENYKIEQQKNAVVTEPIKQTSDNQEVVKDNVSSAPILNGASSMNGIDVSSAPISNGASSMNGIEHLELETNKSLTVEMIKIALRTAENFDSNQKKLVKKVLKLENFPVKKKKFIKFVQNEIENANVNDVQALWDVVEKRDVKTNDSKVIEEDEKMEVSNSNDDKPCLDNSTIKKAMSIELIKTALKAAEISKTIRKKLIKKISKMDDIPSKKKKFIKFIQDDFESADLEEMEAIWNVVEQHRCGFENEAKSKPDTSIDEVEEMMEVVTISNGKNDCDTQSILNESLSKRCGDISIELIKSALRIAVVTDSVQQKLVKKILKLDNIPTTKKKFIKYIQKEIASSDLENIHAMWEIIEKNIADSNSQELNNLDLNENHDIWRIVEKYVGNSEVPQQNGLKSDGLNNDDDVSNMNLIKSAIKNKSFSKPGEVQIKNIILKQIRMPLKKRRFIVFINKQIDNVKSEDIETVWNFIEECRGSCCSTMQPQKRKAGGTESEEIETKKLKLETQFNEKKRKSTENPENFKKLKVEESNEDPKVTQEVGNSFSHQNAICEILNKYDKLSLATLEKKVLKRFRKDVGEASEDFTKMFNKRLKKMPNIKIDGDIVTRLNE